VLDEFDQVPVRVEDERHDDRPALEPFGIHD
jgi:hypothetical protein